MFPWRKRERRAHEEAERARVELEQTQRQRAKVDAIAHDLRHHRLTNGWTETITRIIEGKA